MKSIEVKKTFKHSDDGNTVDEYQPGPHEVSDICAEVAVNQLKVAEFVESEAGLATKEAVDKKAADEAELAEKKEADEKAKKEAGLAEKEKAKDITKKQAKTETK